MPEREDPLQRLFSTFPSGRPGVGLLLLRIALGGTAVALGAVELAVRAGRTPLVWVVASVFLVSGAGLIVGFLTPLASLLTGLCVLGITFSWLPGPSLRTLDATLVVLVLVVTAIGLALLGPGAFSLDGHLFGRREIVIPPRSPDRSLD
jgi:uncharacterized membrane protein YphA (DoxX/SURF4 family)